jgi:hypothetical protein
VRRLSLAPEEKYALAHTTNSVPGSRAW